MNKKKLILYYSLLGILAFDLVYGLLERAGFEMREVNIFIGGIVFASAFYFSYNVMPKLIESKYKKRKKELEVMEDGKGA